MPQLGTPFTYMMQDIGSEMNLLHGFQNMQRYYQNKQDTAQVKNILSQQKFDALTPQAMGAAKNQSDAAKEQQAVTQQLNFGSQLMDAGSKLMSKNPKIATELIEEGRKIRETGIQQQREHLSTVKQEITQVNNWLSAVKDQSSLDAVKAEAEAMYPGVWGQMNLPNQYQGNEKTISALGKSSLNAVQQIDAQIKQIDMQTRAQQDQINIDAKKEQISLDRAKEASLREGIKEKQAKAAKQSAYDQYLTEVDKEDQFYQKELAKARQGVMLNPKKYPTGVAQPTLARKAFDYFEGKQEPAPQSPRDKALADVAQNQQAAHEARLQAIEKKYAAKGVQFTPRSTQAQQPQVKLTDKGTNVGFTMAKLRESNPNASTEELEAWAKKQGYIQ